MINVWIIEDELAAYQLLKRYVDKLSPTCVVNRWLQSVDASIAALKNDVHPDLIFVDVQLSDGNSFEIFAHIKVTCPVIFTTAFDEFAIKAFELNSVDYLLKPLSSTAVQKAFTKYQTYYQPSTLQRLTHDYQTQKSVASREKYFIGRRGNELVNLPSKHIAYIYSDESSFCVTHDKKTYAIQGSLSDLEVQLETLDFIRLNRKVIAHRSAIVTMKKTLGSKLNICLKPNCDFNVTVSRDKTKQIQQWYFNL